MVDAFDFFVVFPGVDVLKRTVVRKFQGGEAVAVAGDDLAGAGIADDGEKLGENRVVEKNRITATTVMLGRDDGRPALFVQSHEAIDQHGVDQGLIDEEDRGGPHVAGKREEPRPQRGALALAVGRILDQVNRKSVKRGPDFGCLMAHHDVQFIQP